LPVEKSERSARAVGTATTTTAGLEVRTETNGTRVARQSLTASMVLVGSNLVSTVFLAITALTIARLLGPTAYGEYALALVLPEAFMLFSGLGMNTALTRYSAYHISRMEVAVARRKSRSAATMLLINGATVGAVNLFAASFFCAVLFHRPELTSIVRLASIAILGQAMLQASTAGFIGWGSTGLAGLASASQALVKLLLSPLLILLGFSVYGAVLAYSVSFLSAGIVFLLVFYSRNLRGMMGGGRRIVDDVKEFFSYGLPEYAGRVLFLFSQQSYLLIVLGAITTNVTVAYYQAATNVATNLWMAPWAIMQALLPGFARLDGAGGDLRSAFNHAQKYSSFVVTPIVFYILGASSLVTNALYGQAYLGSSTYLQLLCVGYLPFALGLSVLPPLLNGLGRTKLTLSMYLASSTVLIVLAPILGVFLQLKVIGLMIAWIVSNVVQLAAGMVLATRVGVRFRYHAAFRSFLAAGASYAGIWLAIEAGLGTYQTLAVSMAAYLLLYLTLAPVLRVMERGEFLQLMELSRGTGLLGRALSFVLRYEIYVAGVATANARRLTRR